MASSSDLTVTREIIDALDGCILTFTRALPDPIRVYDQDGGFRWAYEEKSAGIVQIAKAVRMASGIRAALYLADAGLLPESGSILRMVGDYVTEIIALGEGMMHEKPSSAQQKFVNQFFAPFPSNPEEFESQEREFYVSREELIKAEVRLANDASLDGEQLRSLKRYLNKGYDSFVHGGYQTAMQMYHGALRAFQIRGVTDDRRGIAAAKAGVAGKLHEVVIALEFMAQLWGLRELHVELRSTRHRLDASNEQSL